MQRSIARLKAVSALLFTIVLIPSNGHSTTSLPEPLFPTSRPEVSKVIVQESYFYTIMQYNPPVNIKLISKKEQGSFDTPENAFISIVSAMFAKDYDWFMECWTKPSIIFHKDNDKKNNITPELVKQKWETWLKDKAVVLTHRVETSGYVILGYKLIEPIGHKTVGEYDNVFVNENGKWLATIDLASDPVSWGWRHPEKIIEGLGRKWNEYPKRIFRGDTEEHK